MNQAFDQILGEQRPAIERTICRHLHHLEWSAPKPRTRPCAPCMDLGLTIRLTHGGGA